jgi:glycosyltransferase involved in cell wall biosynthesis
MKLSAFTFIRNGQMLGYPFVESIRSILPIVDEYVIALGPCEDDTEAMIRRIGDAKIRIIHTRWNENMRDRGYVYAQQKMIAQFNTSGDWAFYLEADEVVHEDDLPKIQDALEKHLKNDAVEALYFDFIHFYGNKNTYLDSPGWYRRETRIIRNSIRSYAVDGLFWYVLEKNRVGRYPRAASSGARIFHYGWVRSEEQMSLKSEKVNRYWNKTPDAIRYADIDPGVIREFKGTHPAAVHDWLPPADGVFRVNSDYIPTGKDKKRRAVRYLEGLLGRDLSKRHFTTP